MAVETTSPAAFTATWRDQENRILGQAHGGTMCWSPRLPWRLRVTAEDIDLIVPCGECPGCLEFYRRRLAGRLSSKYVESAAPLYLVRVYAPLERHAELSRKLHRRRGLELEPGFLRLGATSFGVISRERHALPGAVSRMGLGARVEAIRLKRGKRAWRAATGGMLVDREVYGEETNRYYITGLPRAEREDWTVVTNARAKGYSPDQSPRAWRRGQVILVPPAVWMLSRNDRRDVRSALGRADSPERVRAVMARVIEMAARKVKSSATSPAVRPVLASPPRSDAMARRKNINIAGGSPPPPSLSPLPHPQGGGDLSSVHSAGADPPIEAAGDGLWHDVPEFVPRWIARLPEDRLTTLNRKQYNARRERRLLDEALARLKAKMSGRS